MSDLKLKPPRRIAQGGDGSPEHALLGTLLSHARAAPPTEQARERIWARLQGASTSSPRWLFAAIPAAGACAVVLAVALLKPPTPGPLPRPGATLASASGTVLAGGADALAPARIGDPLPPGTRVRTAGESRAEVRFPDGTEVRLRPGSEAAFPDLEGTNVELAYGGLDLDVRLQSPLRFTLRTGAVEARILASRFAVVSTTSIEIAVEDGSVDIALGSWSATVGAGQCWSSLTGVVGPCPRKVQPAAIVDPVPVPASVASVPPAIRRAALSVPAPTPSVLPPEELVVVADGPAFTPIAAPVETPAAIYQRALRLAREHRFAEAAAAFEGLSVIEGEYGALSLYELGRLRQRDTLEPLAARTAFEEYRRRFPTGPLRQEVDLSIIETDLALGRGDLAKGDTEAFLVTYPASERRAQIRLVRANLMRDAGDCASALREYRDLLADTGAAAQADDAAYFAAFCEAKLGQGEQARASLEQYLARFPRGLHRAEAAKALDQGSGGGR